ncbi:MAG TPA: family 43 glycosylhydrolase [Candidatus Blautia intestinavium]|nr:family 43 glycosylhydrolase [Candidatus Blautia intestinavium]HJC56249.1 family 43 glycosylhydrolase [Candidatus Eisenbergiella intestinipullorum]
MEKVYATGLHNPFLPLNIYIPDGEPKVFGERVYLYGSKDVFGGEYCCHKYHVYSADVNDLQHWTDHGPALASTDEYVQEGIGDGVPWSDGLLWAPDVVERDGWYYLYFCLSDGTEGVAKSRRPYGPFTDARQIMMNGEPISGIDPSVLQDGGDYYYTWGQGSCHMAKLKDDMYTLDEATYAEALISHEDGMQGFHEGSSLRKIGDHYCLIYASEYTEAYPKRGGAPTKLDYAVSREIYGPYEYRGTIIDNTGVDPSTWNNHGSVIKIKDQWYVFYHGSSGNRKYNRRARVERIEVDEKNAVIRQAQMTSTGFGEALDPEETLDAAYGCQVLGGACFTEKNGGYPMVDIVSGCSVAFRHFAYGKEAGDWKITLSMLPFQKGKVVVLADGEKKGEIFFAPGQTEAAAAADGGENGAQDGFLQTEGLLCGLSGKKELVLKFESEQEGKLAELYRIHQQPVKR